MQLSIMHTVASWLGITLTWAVYRDVASPLFRGKGVANDYMAVAHVLSAAITEASRQLE